MTLISNLFFSSPEARQDVTYTLDMTHENTIRTVNNLRLRNVDLQGSNCSLDDFVVIHNGKQPVRISDDRLIVNNSQEQVLSYNDLRLGRLIDEVHGSHQHMFTYFIIGGSVITENRPDGFSLVATEGSYRKKSDATFNCNV